MPKYSEKERADRGITREKDRKKRVAARKKKRAERRIKVKRLRNRDGKETIHRTRG